MQEGVRRSGEAGSKLAGLARETPSTRDRYIDFLRALSIATVVLGHWLIAVVAWEGDAVVGVNALDVVPGLWVATWLFQVMPLFFFVGGFSNLVTYRALRRLGEGAMTFLRGRAARLLRPTLVFAIAWAIILPVADRYASLPEGAVAAGLPVLVGPLWFLGVFLLLVAFTPIMEWLHRLQGVRVVLGLAGAVVAVDVIRFAAGVEVVGLANLLFVWLLVHQLGFFYADGGLVRLPRSIVSLGTVVGILAVLALTSLDTYPGSMVGRPSDDVSNMAPPTLPMAAMAIWQIGLALLARPVIRRLLERPGPWKVVIAFNASIMTLFLWHLSAMVLTVAATYPLGFPQPQPGTAEWWITRAPWVLLCSAVLGALVALLGRFERPDLDPAETYWDLRHFYTL